MQFQTFKHIPKNHHINHMHHIAIFSLEWSTTTPSCSFESIPPPKHYPTYGMFVDVDSNNKTGIARVDYMTTITWDGSSWIRTLAELSADGGAKVLEQKNNFTGFFEKQGSNYVNLFFNLNKVGLPDQYLVAFFIEDRVYSNLGQGIFDFTNWVRIPPPQYVISAFPNSIVLRPGDEKKIELEVKSIALPTRTEPKLYLHTWESAS